MDIQRLESFHREATDATYAGDGKRVEPQRPNFKEYEYRQDEFLYRDSYAGSMQSFGQEVIWAEENGVLVPVWTQVYGGGMEKAFLDDVAMAEAAFTFLKKALRQKKSGFQPRGPRHYQEGSLVYECAWTGDITSFFGEEGIALVAANEDSGFRIFTHRFSGGLFRSKSK